MANDTEPPSRYHLAKQVGIILAGGFFSILFSAAAFITGDAAVKAITSQSFSISIFDYYNIFHWLSLLVVGLIFTVFIFINSVILSFIVGDKVVSYSVFKIKEYVTKIEARANQSLSKIEKVDATISSNLKKYRDERKRAEDSFSDIVRFYGEEILPIKRSKIITSIADRPENIHESFILSKSLIESEPVRFCMLGTMLGTHGENTAGLPELLQKLVKEKKLLDTSTSLRPFKEANFCSPGFRLSGNAEEDAKTVKAFGTDGQYIRALYPYGNRLTAGLILLLLYEECNENLDDLTRSDRLSITLKFAKTKDIFPAQHIWEDKKSIIIPSVGYTDRRSTIEYEQVERAIMKSAPAALVFRKSYDLPVSVNASIKCDLTESLKRIQSHFDQDWMKPYSNDQEMEIWSINNAGKFSIQNVTKLHEDQLFLSELLKLKENISTKQKKAKIEATIKFVTNDIIKNSNQGIDQEYQYAEFKKILSNLKFCIDEMLSQ